MVDDATLAAPIEGQTYYHPEGAALYVRTEQDGMAVLVLTHDRVVFTRRVPVAELGSKYKPEFTPALNDTDRGRLSAEHAALSAVLSSVEALVFDAAGRTPLDHKARTALAADVIGRARDRYRQRLKEAGE